MARGRRNYEQVTTNPDEIEPGDVRPMEVPEAGAPRSTTNRGAAAEDTRESAQVALLDEPEAVAASDADSLSGASEMDDDEGGDGDFITIIVLDVAQKKFPVRISPNSRVRRLKEKGRKVHKVPADRQRLIFQGRMLADDKTLEEEKIRDQVIVHLFPKPRVLIKDSEGKSVSRGDSTTDDPGDRDGSDDEEGGARVPTIVMNADEAQQRSQILVLGSADYLEASNNVKLFSFMLLIISSIELINLLALALGVPQDDPNADSYGYDNAADDIFPSEDDANASMSNSTSTHSGPNDPPEWSVATTFDLIISIMGVYVAIMGLKATTSNTLRVARIYLMGTFLTGIGWCLFNYVMTYELDEEIAHKREETEHMPHMTRSDLAWQALTVMVLPCMVWMLCCLRAWQFQYLLREAEQEAEERTRSELANITGESPQSIPSSDEEEGAVPADNGTMA